MSEPKFTKGPWHWERSRTQMHLHSSIGNFAEVSMPIPGRAHPSEVGHTEIAQANAHLIVSAPELYEALEGVTRAAKSMNDHLLAAGGNPMSEVERRISVAYAALAKANPSTLHAAQVKESQ